jgi:hypothetical protein
LISEFNSHVSKTPVSNASEIGIRVRITTRKTLRSDPIVAGLYYWIRPSELFRDDRLITAFLRCVRKHRQLIGELEIGADVNSLGQRTQTSFTRKDTAADAPSINEPFHFGIYKWAVPEWSALMTWSFRDER